MNPPNTLCLPDRPWLIGGGRTVGLVRVQGQAFVPVFRTAADARAFMVRLGTSLPSHFYPLFPEADEFVALLAAAMRDGAQGYVFVEDGCWHVIGFAMPVTESAELVGV